MSHRYLWGPVTDQLFADEQVTVPTSNGNVLWPLADHLGTIRDIADYNESSPAFSITNHRDYDTFGRLESETNSAIDLSFGYTGKQFDDATSLYNYLNRWYDPRAGKFLSEDPIGFSAGDANLSRYVGNTPTMFTDPLGLQAAFGDDGSANTTSWSALQDETHPNGGTGNQRPASGDERVIWHSNMRRGTADTTAGDPDIPPAGQEEGAVLGGWTERGIREIIGDNDLMNQDVEIVAFQKVVAKWIDDKTGEETWEEADNWGFTNRQKKTIRLRNDLPLHDAATMLIHELNHLRTKEPTTPEAVIDDEVFARIETEKWLIEKGWPPWVPGYRDPEGTIDEAEIRKHVDGIPIYNPDADGDGRTSTNNLRFLGVKKMFKLTEK